ncbi:uncharacterized protein LOC107786901 [Nicotiana tabacum]|uniref:Uncharacterized protein LOC107786901 n=2 Tax=Nicotiana TaxID=4085 RepID=A0A1S3ZI18_TOBAC|nr:PREDICTED: uncharacterized protein LOC104215370 [Nicotiana sylvestris]XP_016463902.1 PREDICTED: uncharacterized protein LOC107786901 [Nicotiana tabacum]
MGFFSFLGRVLFASVFILSAWQMFHEFGEDGGPAAKELAPKVAGLQDFLESKLGAGAPKIDVRHVVAFFMALKGLGGLLFVFGSFTGAVILMFYLMLATPLLHDICHLNFGEPQYFTLLQEFLQSVSLLGALLFFVGMKNSINRRQPKKKTLKPKTA